MSPQVFTNPRKMNLLSSIWDITRLIYAWRSLTDRLSTMITSLWRIWSLAASESVAGTIGPICQNGQLSTTRQACCAQIPLYIGRLKYLADAFPGSRFIHISRDPYSLIPSTVRLWQSLDYIQGFNRPKYDLPWLYEYIGDTFETLYELLNVNDSDIDESQLIDVRYEDLVADAARCDSIHL